MYHDVGYAPEDGGTIAPEDLAAQWSWLRGLGYVNIDMERIGRELALGRLEGGRRFAVTFDDGRAGVYRHALPLLQSFGFTATVYLVPGFLGQTRWFSRHLPESWVTPEESVSAGGIRLTYMSLEETRRWIAGGQRVGSHTLTHRHLSGLDDPDLEHEIGESARVLEEQLGLAGGGELFAYPYGEYNRRIERLVARRHATAVTVEQSPVRPTTRPSAVPRIDPGRRREEMILRFARQGLI